jgi:class 3 adenylate cyclase
MTAISEARWQEAQRYEAAWWANEARNPEALARGMAESHHFLAGLLDIRRETVCGATVLDIAGGPHPLGVGIEALGIGRYTIIDPAAYVDVDGVHRVRVCAEDYVGDGGTEVWGYNVLQHVRDPAAVMAVARRRAERRIRWFDVVDTPVYPVHPHSIKADWLRAELSRDGFRITRDLDGSRFVDGHRQKWVTLIAERS